MANSAPASALPASRIASLSRSGDSGWPSGNAATPTQKSPSPRTSATSSSACRKPSTWASQVPRGPLGRVAPQREHVAHAGVGVLPDDLAQLGDGRAHAGEVRDRGHRGLGRDALGDAYRAVAGRAAGAVGHRHERRGQPLELAQRLPQRALALVGLGREELERVRVPALGEQLADRAGAARHRRCVSVGHGAILTGLPPNSSMPAAPYAHCGVRAPLDAEDLRVRVQKSLDDFVDRPGPAARRDQRGPRAAGRRDHLAHRRRQAAAPGVLLLGLARRRRRRRGADRPGGHLARAAAGLRPDPRRRHGRLRHPAGHAGGAPALRRAAPRQRLARRARTVRRGRRHPARRPLPVLGRRDALRLRATGRGAAAASRSTTRCAPS